MGTVQDEYGRFMRWLGNADIEPDVRSVAKIVHANLDVVASTVSAGGQRARVLTPLLRRDLTLVDDQIADTVSEMSAVPLPWTRLRKLTVGPFRGFRREETFDLRKPVVLFYGPNGSGKTSLCEAIEFALIGGVEEAAAKRIDSLTDYFDNIHEGHHALPQLWSEGGADGVPVIANEELLRFAIIEKNRIEGFARLAARPPAQASVLIATLFGLDAFNDFVNGFTNSLDRQLLLERPKKAALQLKKMALESARQKMENCAEVIRAFQIEQEQIASEFEEGCSGARLIGLLGTPENPGRLQEITSVLDEQVPAKSGVRWSDMVTLRRNLRIKYKDLVRSRAKLVDRSTQLSYRDLYRAIQSMEASATGICPACETPLEKVTNNPYERAALGLNLLQDLAALEDSCDRLLRECDQLSRQLKDVILKATGFFSLEEGAFSTLAEWARHPEHTHVWKETALNKDAWRAWMRIVRRLEIRDSGIQQSIDRRAEIIAERVRLDRAKERLIELNGRRSQHAIQIANEQAFIESFDTANENLKKEVVEEEATCKHEERIQASYAGYLDAIRLYRDSLPEGLLVDLNETARDIYNQFNADDHDSDKIAKLSLPLRGGDRIMVAFNRSPDRMHDALNLLSEGHLRCLGLAILLAKNIKLELPILVFDDAVNAIDHDHRAGIRATIFGEPRINEKQILITCHSNEFIKDIQNQLGESTSKLYVLDHHAGDHQPIVRGGTDRNYLVRARDRLGDGDQRQCLASCRQSLENLTARIWKALYNKSNELGAISLRLRSPSSRPELRELTVELERRIGQGILQGVLTGNAWVSRHEGLEAILNVPENHLSWQYLNKGTHEEEDREDFEIQIVRSIVEALTKISATFGN